MRALTAGVSLTKTTNSAAWDQQAYSNVSFTGGAYASARAFSNWAMFGLNTDPLTDASFTSIDFAWYTSAANDLRISESGVDRGSFGVWAVGDLLEIIYDNANVKYYKNGVLIRTVARAAGAVFFFDSSFYSTSPVFGGFTNVKFGPDAALRNIGYTTSAGVTITFGEYERLTGPAYNIHVQSESQDADGTWQTHNTLQGTDWQTAFKYRGDADTPYVAGTIELVRADRTLSMAPLMTGSVINRNAALAYAPFLDALRRTRVKTAITPQFVAPVAADWRYVFDGYIDKVSVGGRDDNSIILECRDLGALLVDTDIEVIRQYGSSAGTAVETVMQQILDDNLGAGAVTLYTPVSPNWLVHEFSQKTQSLMEGIRALAKQIGYEVRYLYDATNTLRLTFYAPDRAKVISDYVFGPSVYTDITKLDVEGADVRNAWTVEYIDRATGNKLTAIATSAPSIAQYKRRPARIAYGYSSNIDSATEAQKMVNAALADTAFPKALEVVDLPYWPLTDIADLITLQANGEHYDTDQQRAVLSYEHDLRDGDGTTTLTTRGSPAGGYDTWMSMVGGMTDGPSLTVTDTVGGTPAANHSVAYTGSWDTIQLSIDGAAWIVPGASPLSVTPNPAGGAAKQYAFRAIKNGQIVTQTVYVATPPPLPPQAIINHLNTEIDDSQWEIQLNAVVGSGGGGANLSWTMWTKVGFATEGLVASGNATALPSSRSITRNPRLETVVRLTVTDAVTGLSDTARLTVPSSRPEINGTGNPLRIRPWDDGSYALRSGDATGTNAHSAVADSRAFLLSSHFNTVQHTADNVPTGALSRVVPFSVLRASDNQLLSGVDYGATIAGQNAHATSRQTGSYFSEKFDVLPSNWQINGSSGPTNISLVAGVAKVGQFVLQSSTVEDWRYFPQYLAFNPTKLYRIRSRFRATVDVSSGGSNTYIGVACTDSAGTYIGNVYVGAVGVLTTVAGGWIEQTGFYKGVGALSSHYSSDARSPVNLLNNTSRIQPVYILRDSAGVGGTHQLDYITIDELDEDLSGRGYSAINASNLVIRSRGMDDANYAAAATNSVGTALHGNVMDSRTFLVNAHFNTGVHTMDNVPEGGTYGKSSFTRLGYSDRAGLALSSGGNVVSSRLFDDGGYALIGGTRSAAYSGATDSRSFALNTHFNTGVHTLDNVTDGGTYGRVAGVNGSHFITPSSTIGRASILGFKTNGQTVATGTTPVQLTLDNASWILGLGITRSGNQFIVNDVVAAAGAWMVVAQVGWAGNATGDRHAELRRNGTVIGQATLRAAQNNPTIIPIIGFASSLALADQFDVYIWQDSGVSLAVRVPVAETFFMMTHLW